MRISPILIVMAGAIFALAVWPSFMSRQAPAASFTPAPVMRDYTLRNQYVSFYEREVRNEPGDQIKMRMLAALYLQRFREQYDLTDVSRAEKLAERSLQLQPQGNTAAQMTLASALLTYHDFRGALVHERDAYMGEPSNAGAQAQIASLELELGHYEAAKKMLDGIADTGRDNPTVDSVRARYDELTGNLSLARALIAKGIRTVDSGVDTPAYDRSWFHMRAAQLAFEAGDFTAAGQEFDTSLKMFPDNAMALMWQGRMYRAQKDWPRALAVATKSADLYPLPQALGYKADAQRALGDASGAAQTDALIGAEERLFNVAGINDRLLANYYAQRHMHLDTALRAAKSDYEKRGDEIYADDTMAWVLGALGRWREARPYAEHAVRFDIQDADLEYHAAVIAQHTGHSQEAKRRLELALHDNPQFDPFEAGDARARLAMNNRGRPHPRSPSVVLPFGIRR
ncbi:MAG TPA: tetratricopeptide repeat protein [Candidatus Baltobacteraceae bacterium]|nr:tetratricopeptide repeat protein [Candidatus Baltobacteraceae bacterium]